MTAVEFLVEEIKKLTGLNIADDEPVIDQAKEMEKEQGYSDEDMRKAIYFMPYHLEYGNIVARKSDKDIENFIEQFKKKQDA